MTDERFWSKVDKREPDECWNWLAFRTQKGYGQVGRGGKVMASHRVSWELHHGPVRDSLHVLHKCDNPSCVNPAHLFLGDNADNMADRDAKDRVRHGNAHKWSKLDALSVRLIRRLRKLGLSYVILGRAFGVCDDTIRLACIGKNWRRVNG